MIMIIIGHLTKMTSIDQVATTKLAVVKMTIGGYMTKTTRRLVYLKGHVTKIIIISQLSFLHNEDWNYWLLQRLAM